MRILYVTHSLPVGGAENLVVSYLLRLKERGEDVALMELSHCESFLSRRIEESGIPIYTIIRNNLLERLINRLRPSFFIKRCNKVIETINPDIIHFQTIFSYMDSLNFSMEKCVFTFHSRVKRCFNIGEYVNPLFVRLSLKGLRFVAISSKIKEDIHDYFPHAIITSIPNGVALQEIREGKEEKKTIRKELGILETAFVVGQVGRFNKVKNHLFSLDVFSEVLRRNANAILMLVGDGNDDEKRVIEEKIRANHLEGKVLFLGLRDDAIRLMCGMDVLIHPSFSESFSLTLIEAQANNIRCVASNEIPREVICNKNCFQLSLNEPIEKWADLILSNKERESFSDLKKFDLDVVIDRHIELYKSLKSNI